MWEETRRVPLISAVQLGIKIISETMQVEGMKEDASLKGRVDALQRKIEKRKKDPRYHVTVKHVGSADDPRAWERMRAEYQSKLHDIRVKARKQVMEEGGAEDMDRAIDACVGRNPATSEALAKYARECIEAGLEDGPKEYTRLWKLGGDSLLLDALAEVRAYQEMDPEMGEE